MITTKQLHPLFVGEVSGVDLRGPLEPAMVEAIVHASDRYAVLVFRDQDLTDEQQVAFSTRLGPLETTIRKLRPGHELRLDQHVSDISNLDHQGNVLEREDRRRMYSLGDRLWHTDSSFKALPAKYSLLSARAIPSRRADAVRRFACGHDALPDAMKSQLEGLVAEHSIIYSRSTIGFTDFADEERAGCRRCRRSWCARTRALGVRRSTWLRMRWPFAACRYPRRACC